MKTIISIEFKSMFVNGKHIELTDEVMKSEKVQNSLKIAFVPIIKGIKDGFRRKNTIVEVNYALNV